MAWFVSNRSQDKALNKARFDRSTLIASGSFIAGGALMGVVSAVLKFAGAELEARRMASSNARRMGRAAIARRPRRLLTGHTLRAKRRSNHDLKNKGVIRCAMR